MTDQAPRDNLLFDGSLTARLAALWEWHAQTPALHPFVPDYHRLQLERWLWDRFQTGELGQAILDVGVYDRRAWMGDGYRTLNEHGEADVIGSVEAMPLPDASLDTVVCTEVLEHTRHPWDAMASIFRVLRPGGRVLVTSPFLWPWHGTDEYRDFWRFTHDGWAALLERFEQVTIQACRWTDEGRALYDLVRRFECMGFASTTAAHTAYLCEGVKPR